MDELELLTLDLRSPLPYWGLENPPFTGAPFAGTTLIPEGVGGAPAGSGILIETSLGVDMAEGEEELFLFEEEDLVAFDPDDGPVLRRPLPRPSFYGRRSAADTAFTKLAAGSYIFLQWLPLDENELLEGLEWFAREAWWERAAAKGPYFLRRIREDGRLATQAMRRID
jgi:hypothetical protein